MNYIELAQDEVVIHGDVDIVIPMAQFEAYAQGIYDEYDVKGQVSMDVGESEVYFFTDTDEVMIPMHHAIEIAMAVL